MAAELKRFETELPARLVAEVQALVDAGWFRDRDAVITEALRRYLESHQPQLIERFVRQDIDWGLRGEE